MPKGIKYKKFNKEGRSVRVKNQEFRFSEFADREKKQKLNKMARSIVANFRSSSKEEETTKNRTKAKKAVGK